MRKPTEQADAFTIQSRRPESVRGEGRVVLAKAQPHITYSRWAGHRSVQLQYRAPLSGGKLVADGVVGWSDGVHALHAYDLEPQSVLEEGGLELEVVLAARPTVNAWSFSVGGWEQFDFFRQEPFENINPDGSSWGIGRFGGVGQQPAEYAGSYAVYAKGVHGYVSGAVNFETGKMFHILRPKAVDANGEAVWGDLVFADGVLTVTVPQSFLDRAQYPLRVDPTFGFTSIGANEDAGATFVSRLIGDKAAPGSNGTVDSITMYTKVAVNTNQFKGAIVLASSKAFVTNGVSNAKTCNDVSAGTPAWFTATYSTSPSVTGGTDYYVCYIGGGSDPWGSHFYDTAASGTDIYDSSNNFTTPTDPTDAADSADRVSCYATYTAAGAGDDQSWYPIVGQHTRKNVNLIY